MWISVDGSMPSEWMNSKLASGPSTELRVLKKMSLRRDTSNTSAWRVSA